MSNRAPNTSRPRSRRSRVAPWAALAALSSVAACSDTEPDTGGSGARADAAENRDNADAGEADASARALAHWVGEVEQTDIRFGAVSRDRERLRLFFCGGLSTVETATRWLSVDVRTSDGRFAYEDDAVRVTGRLSEGDLVGELEAEGGERREFEATRAGAKTLAGLYEGDADCGRVGLIVMQVEAAGPATGQGACVGPGHPPEQVNPILPITLEAGAIRVEVDGQQASVREARPPT